VSTGSNPKHSTEGSASSPQGKEEQTFSILPHPAQSNDPADLQGPADKTGRARNQQTAFSAFTSNPGPVQLDDNMLKNMPPAKSSEELKMEQAKLDRQG